MALRNPALTALIDYRDANNEPIVRQYWIMKGAAKTQAGREIPGARVRQTRQNTGVDGDVSLWVVRLPEAGVLGNESNLRDIVQNHKREVVRIDETGALFPDGAIALTETFKYDELAAKIIAAHNAPDGLISAADLDALRADIIADAWDAVQRDLVDVDLRRHHQIDITRLDISVDLDHYRLVYDRAAGPADIDDYGNVTWPDHKAGMQAVADAIRSSQRRASNRFSRSGKTGVRAAWAR